jgi:MFS family permease
MPKIVSPLWLTVIVCLAEVFSMTGAAVVSGLTPVLKQEWSLSNTAVGWLNGINHVGYVIAVPILAGLTDRIAPRVVYCSSLLIGMLACLGFAYFAADLWSALLYHMLMGVGLAGTYMPGLKILSDRLAGKAQSRATALYTSSFGIGLSASFFVSGQVERASGWHEAFFVGAIGPLVAILLIVIFISRDDPKNFEAPETHLLDFRPVLRCRAAMGYVLAYTVHNFELFAFRSFMVLFLVFAQKLHPENGFTLTATTLAAIITLFGQPASFFGNEGALRFGRHRWITGVMIVAAIFAAMLGFLAAIPFWALFTVCCIYMYSINSDSAAITSGMVGVAPPGYRGATMAVHSCLGFSGSAMGPLLFGVVLDLSGSGTSVMSWGLSFASVAVIGLLGPIVLWWSRRP